MTVSGASLDESGSNFAIVAATSLLLGVTRTSSEAYFAKLPLNRVGGKQRILGVFLLLPLFPDLSHHRTCRSAYGGSLHSVQLNVVVHKARVASTAKFIVPRSMVHYAFRIGPISFATVPIDSRPVWLDATLN